MTDVAAFTCIFVVSRLIVRNSAVQIDIHLLVFCLLDCERSDLFILCFASIVKLVIRFLSFMVFPPSCKMSDRIWSHPIAITLQGLV